MNKPTRFILASFFACFSFVPAYAQTPTTLRPGNPVERELATGDVHTFTVDLEENSVMQLVVEQKGIDVVVSISSADGKLFRDYDTPNGPNGLENVSFVALAAGTYSISVEPLDSSSAAKGRYQIKILELRKATDDETRKQKNLEIAKGKSIELVRDLEGIITQIKKPESRIKARVRAADLLWDDDEKRAAKYLADATADLKELIASVDATDLDYSQQYSAIWQIRFEMVQLLGEIDPEAALNLLQSTTPPMGGLSDQEMSQESGLQLSVASQMIEKNPQRAFDIARRGLKQAYSMELMRVVQELGAKDPKLASQLANEIVDKLLTEKFSQNTQATQLALGLMSLNRAEGNGAAIYPITANAIPQDRFKLLLQKALDEVLSFSLKGPSGYQFSPSQWTLLHSLRSLGADLDKIISGSSAAVSKKYEELFGRNTVNNEPQGFDGSVEEVLQTIEGTSLENRDQLYISLAQREAANGDTQRGRQIINDFVKNPAQRNQWFFQIAHQEINHAIQNGKTDEALRLIGALRRPGDRASHLVQFVGSLGAGHNRATVLNLLEQSRALLPTSPQAQDGEQMHALFEIARAFARHDSKRAFEIIDPLLDQFNELCAAARTLNGFGGDFYKDEELNQDGNSIVEAANQLTTVLASLALADFERSKSTSDRIRLTELRLKAYLDIATSVIQGDPNSP